MVSGGGNSSGGVITTAFHTLCHTYMQAEEAVRQVDADLARCRQRCVQLEASIKQRDAEIARLSKTVNQTEVWGEGVEMF